MTLTGLAELVIEDEVGCGLFQVFIVIFVFVLLRISAVFTFIFMAYGNYNPGWRCVDNDTDYFQNFKTLNESHQFSTLNTTTILYSKDLTCQQYEACRKVEFDPESSTIVTEWGLVCGSAWIASLLISIQMVGNLAASFTAGYVADRLGRRKTVYGALFINSVLTLLSSFSFSWQTLAASRFCIGVCSAFFESVIYVYSSEFFTRKWRGPLSGVPGWAFGGMIFGVTCMLLKNWRHLLITSSVVCFIGFLPVFWVPESLRWLEVKGKKEQFKSAAKKMAHFNKKDLHENDSEIFSLNSDLKKSLTAGIEEKSHKQYNISDIFKEGYKFITFIVGFVWLSLSFIYYAIGFGIKALSGDFYLNFILLYVLLILFSVFPLFAPNLLGRTKSSCIFMLIVSISLLAATLFEKFTLGFTRTIGTLVLVLVAGVGTETTWCIQQAQTSEMYPTVVRGLAMNWACLMARVGGIVAPFLIPRDSSSVYLWYLCMAVQGLFCCGLIARLPETRGKPLKETFSVNSLEIIIKPDIQKLHDNDSRTYKIEALDAKIKSDNVPG